MLNYILPPIIIVISVSALIMFLFRKAKHIPAADLIAQQELNDDQKKNIKVASFFGHLVLKFLERLMHHTKLISLKFHNLSNQWFQVIREKRQRASQIANEVVAEKNTRVPSFAQSINEPISVTGTRSEPRPMITRKATLPQAVNMIKEKNKFEDVLIKRIAINPKDIEAYERLGDYYLENQNFQDSLECFRQVLKLAPSHHKARLKIRRLERMR